MNLKQYIYTLILFLVLVIPTSGQSCYCNTWPFVPDPPCFDKCAANLLIESDISRLQEVLKLPDNLLAIVIGLRGNATVPGKLSEALSSEAYRELEKRLRRLDKDSFDYLRGN